MKFVGIQEQIRNNNRKSVFLLLAFPLLILVSLFAIIYFLNVDQYQNYNLDLTIDRFLQAVPFVLAFVLIWFVIAYFGHSKMIAMATGAGTWLSHEYGYRRRTLQWFHCRHNAHKLHLQINPTRFAR